ncbi:MAG: molybdopterin-dependent oxidoreductase, partial [Pseudobacteriovorax sp.]|nr:molybdopterin-dependent oxidoreductase [Pseudobacteriovorax sp.]
MKLHDDPKDLSRRDFIVKSSVATVASMTFAVVLPACTTTGDQKRKQGSKAFSNAWVTIDSSGKLEFVCPRTEMGQGTGTGLSMLLCESMDYPIGKVTMVQAPADRLYKHKEYQLQTTGGSSSMHTEFEAMLNLGASIRDLFLRAAAKKYQVPVSSLKTSAGHVLVKGKKISYADLIPEAQTLDIMDIEFDPKKIRKGLVGKRIRRVDLNEKVDGSLKYGVDTDFEGLHHAYMIHAPILGALPKNSNADAIKKLPGVTDVVKTSRGFAVVATKHWQAMNAAGQLKTEWNEPEKVFDSGAYEKECLAHLKGDSHKNILDEGDSYKEQKTSL